MKLNAIANGLGAQSLSLVVLAARGDIPAKVSITADTGSEEDRVWSTGRRSTAKEYFDGVVYPYSRSRGIEAHFVRATDRDMQDMPSLLEHTRSMAAAGKLTGVKLPVFGSNGGRLGQSCTQRWKIQAIKQQARRLGATHLHTFQGIHFGEADRRVKGLYLRQEGRWSIYQETIRRDGQEVPVKWCTHCYPLVDLRMKREDARALVESEGLPYLISSECDFCPHQDLARWERHTAESLADTAALESKFNGEYFFTDERVPLMEALARKRARKDAQPELDFGCENGYCGI